MKEKDVLDQSIEERLQEVEDKYVRLYAEFENYKKRTQKEKEDIRVDTKIRMISSILDMDNDIAIAIKNIDDSAKDGVLLIAKKLESFLKSHGIESIQTDTYDEELHEVISILPSDKVRIIEVISKGYTINGEPFRYPKIILGK